MGLESLRCPSCGNTSVNKSQNNDYLCDHCGTVSRLSSDLKMLILGGWECSSCHTRNEQGSKFCGTCGTQIVKYCFTCGAQTQVMTMYCQQCGGQNFSDKRGCDVFLDDYPPNEKVNVVYLVRLITGLDLRAAVAFVERPGGLIKSAESRQEAESIKAKFQKTGARVRIE